MLTKALAPFFTGRLGRKHYFLSALLLTIPTSIILTFTGTPLTFVIISLYSLSRIIIDAKRLRDLSLPGKISPILFGIISLSPGVYLYRTLNLPPDAYLLPPAGVYLSGLIGLILLICFLSIRGHKAETKYGRPTSNLTLKEALLNKVNNHE